MIEITQTPYGNLYKKTRDIVESDIKTEVVEPKEIYIEDFSDKWEVPTLVEGKIICTIVNQNLRDFIDESKWMRQYGGDPSYVTNFAREYDYINYRGCRGIAGRVKRFNKEVNRVWDSIVSCSTEKIEDGIIELNSRLDKFIESKNKETTNKACTQYTTLRLYQKEWLDKVDDPQLMTELEQAEKAYREASNKLSQLKEAVRKNRAESAKKNVVSPSDPKYVLPEEMHSPILEALDHINAMTNNYVPLR
jgi:hypothetical protein